MKHLLLLTLTTIFFSSCSYTRIGDLTEISNRNIDSSEEYVLLQRGVETKATANVDVLETAVTQLTNEHNGEFLRNAEVFIKSNGKKVKLIGDVWGIQSTQVNIETSAEVEVNLKVGDPVVFDHRGRIKDGKIIGMNSNKVIIEFGNNKKRIELNYDQVTKTTEE